jgi:hypothetical protein
VAKSFVVVVVYSASVYALGVFSSLLLSILSEVQAIFISSSFVGLHDSMLLFELDFEFQVAILS